MNLPHPNVRLQLRSRGRMILMINRWLMIVRRMMQKSSLQIAIYERLKEPIKTLFIRRKSKRKGNEKKKFCRAVY